MGLELQTCPQKESGDGDGEMCNEVVLPGEGNRPRGEF